jgi:hypothetical protein
MQRPPHMERPTSVIGRFAKRVPRFSLIPAVCATVLLAAACCRGGGSGSTPVERVPASARVLMVTLSYPAGSEPAGSKPPRPVSVTVTDLARVRRIAGLIDGLSLASPGEEWACPAFTGAFVNLAFRGSASGRTLADARFNMSGCGGLGLTTGGVQQAFNITPDTSAPQVLQIAGVRAPTAS